MTHKLTNILLVVSILLVVALLVLILGTTWFLWHEKATAESTLRAANAAAIEVGLTAKNLREASLVWKQSSKDQASAITSAAQSATVAVKQLSQSASAVEKSSTALLNELTLSVNEQNGQLSQTQEQARANLRDLQAAEGELQRMLRSGDQQISNPAIGETISHLDEASANAAATLGEADKTVTDVRQVADKFRETYLKPINLWWAGFEKLLGIGPPIVTAIK